MGGLSWWHWLVIGGAFILIFGAKKLPDAARGLGRSLRILRSEVSAMNDDSTATPAEPTIVLAPESDPVVVVSTTNGRAPQFF